MPPRIDSLSIIINKDHPKQFGMTTLFENGNGAPDVLAVTSQLPWPLNSGGHLRTYHLLRALACHCQVRLVVPTETEPEEAISALQEAGIGVRTVAVGPRRTWREAVRVGASALQREPYVFYRRHDHPDVRDAIRAEAERKPPEVLYLDHLDSLVYRRILPEVPAMIDLHNVYSSLAQRASSEQSDPGRRLYLRREAALLERVERRAAREAELLMAVSEVDARHFASLGALDPRVVPNGVDFAAYADLPTGRPPGDPVLLYVGALSWDPNVRAAQWLAEEVLPRVQAQHPKVRLLLVGRDPTASVQALGERPGVEVAADVPDVRPYLLEASALAVPLEAGGGSRLKILEAFAAGLPVVSTPVGCEGLDVEDGEQLVITSRETMAEAILTLLDDPPRAFGLADRARVLARDQYDWSAVGQTAVEALKGMLGKDSEERIKDEG